MTSEEEAELIYHTMIEGPEPESICPKRGYIGTQVYICRFAQNHAGPHYFEVQGAVPIPDGCRAGGTWEPVGGETFRCSKCGDHLLPELDDE